MSGRRGHRSVKALIAEHKGLRERMRERGWTYRVTSKHHVLLFDEKGHPVGTLLSNEEPHQKRNERAALRRGCTYGCGGLDV